MKFISFLWKTIRIIFLFFGAIAMFFIILAFTSAPFWTWYNFSTKYSGINRPPDYIIVLGGGGMPSESGLIRCWYAAKVAGRFPKAKVIISLPGDTTSRRSSINSMKAELQLRGISENRIFLESEGTNTRAQALGIQKRISNIDQRMLNKEPIQNSKFVDQNSKFKSLLIVTSPEHLTRSVLTFKNVGFVKVDGLPAFEEAIEGNITFKGDQLGGRKWIPDVGENITLRYQFWTQMNYEFLLLREIFAMGYYKLKGWI
jgi:uncharacterized SAM-binding protein YcdF (DUF218 family)